MEDARKSGRQFPLLAFSTAAAATAAIVGIAAYMYMVRRLAGDPTEILQRCQSAIDEIEHNLHLAAR